MRAIWVFSLAVILLAGCAKFRREKQPAPPPIKPPSEYVQPRVERLSGTSRLVWKPMRAVWHSVMLAASRTDHFIDSAKQQDGLMTLLYSGDPIPYIDCGRVVRSVKTTGGEQNFDFPAATAYQQYEIASRGKIYQVERRMALTARTALTFTAVASNRTRVDAKTVYAVTRDQSAITAGEKPILLHDTISFGTGESGVFPNAATRCQSTGRLEQEVLGLLK